MTAEQLEAGYWRAYRDFYRWRSIWRGAATKPDGAATGCGTSPTPAAGRSSKPLWDLLIRSRQVLHALPLLEAALASFGRRPADHLSRPQPQRHLAQVSRVGID